MISQILKFSVENPAFMSARNLAILEHSIWIFGEVVLVVFQSILI